MPSDLVQPPPELMHRWRIMPTAYLGGRWRQHWLVSTGSTELVLAASPADVTYELDVQRHLLRAGWPVPELVGGPVRLGDRTWYLATRLPGTPVDGTDAQRRRRGHLLAELHESTAQLTGLGQRNGFVLADALVADRELDAALGAYERLRPTEGRIMRWHLDWARAAFARLDLSRAEPIVLHGDFAPWNLLFEGERLSGILDFEASHLDYRVADFALSWRGDQDDVLAGYAEVYTLSDLDWELLVPVFWSWLFMGMPRHISDILEGRSEPHGFDWQINHLLKRSNAIRRRVPRFRHPG